MKTKNIELGNFLYVKTTEEMEKSKYFEEKSNRSIWFSDGSSYFSHCLDGDSCGRVLQVIDIDGDDIKYRKTDGSLGKLSRHCFRKPTKKELLERKKESQL